MFLFSRWFTHWQLNQEMLKHGSKNPYCVTYQEDLQQIELPTEVPRHLSKDSLEEVYDQGYALPKAKKAKRFSKDQTNFVEEKFFAGQQTNQKFLPAMIAKMMREEKVDGKLRFGRHDWLSEEQINSYCSRIVAKLKNPDAKEITKQEEEEVLRDMQNLSEHEERDGLHEYVNQSRGDNLSNHPFEVSDLFLNFFRSELKLLALYIFVILLLFFNKIMLISISLCLLAS